MRFGIIGYGQFGSFMASHLATHGEVRTYDAHGTGTHTLEETCDVDVLIFAVPVQALAEAAEAAAPHVARTVLIIDVSSVKVEPLKLLARHFPQNELLGTHPIFGPQSGKDGIKGLTVVFSNVAFTKEHYAKAKSFVESALGLVVIEKTADEHDREMARVQALAHFIGRALKKLEVVDYPTATKSYRHLLELRDLLIDDSWDLFETIQNKNPYAKGVRAEFLSELKRLEELLSSG